MEKEERSICVTCTYQSYCSLSKNRMSTFTRSEFSPAEHPKSVKSDLIFLMQVNQKNKNISKK